MPKTFDDDWIAFPHPTGVLARLKTILEAERIPAPCTTGIVPGEIVALDYVSDECESFGWGRVVSVFPSTNFPNPDETPNRVLAFATIIEIGIVRRAVVPDNGEAADIEELYESARGQLADMRAILQALCEYAGEDIPMLIGQYQPLGPEGGVVGGSWTATVGAI